MSETNPIKILQAKAGVSPDGAWGPATFKAASAYFKLSHNRAVNFFAQTSHETGNYTKFSENLNYSAQGLLGTFKSHFNANEVDHYARQPEKIANRVYANRMGNGDEASGDGWKYRGRGALQLTGKANYQAFATHINRPDVMTNPDIVATELAFESALFFFETNHLWEICDRGTDQATVTALTKRVNGGTIGLDDRISRTNQLASWA